MGQNNTKTEKQFIPYHKEQRPDDLEQKNNMQISKPTSSVNSSVRPDELSLKSLYSVLESMSNNLLNTESESEFDVQYEAKNIKEIEQKLDTFGICYIPNTINKDQCVEMISGTWKFFEHITQNFQTPIKCGDSSTWSSFDALCGGLGMMYQGWNIGHAQHLWNLRQHENIANVYAQLYRCNKEDLLVSFDGQAFQIPPEYTDKHWDNESKCHLHLDQSLYHTERDGYQSFITANDIKEGDATIRFLEGSHLLINEFNQRFGKFKSGDWVVFEKEHLQFLRSKCREKFLRCPAGSMVLWDSRLAHCGSNPRRGRENKSYRCIAYISYAPRYKAKEMDIVMKTRAFDELYTSNHYAHRPTYFRTIPQDSLISEDEYVQIDPPILSRFGYILAGFTNEEIDEIFEEDYEN